MTVNLEEIRRQAQADDGVEKRWVFAVEPEIVELDPGPAADEICGFIHGGAFVERRQPRRRPERRSEAGH